MFWSAGAPFINGKKADLSDNNEWLFLRFPFQPAGFIRLAVSVNQYMHKICKYSKRNESAVRAFENVPVWDVFLK